MGYFHSNNGLCFERLEDGSVEVTRRLWGWADPHGDKKQADVVDHRWRMTASEWASVVSSVSKPGETNETWRTALDFHDDTRHAPDCRHPHGACSCGRGVAQDRPV